MKKNLIVLLVCMIFFTGCSSLCITSNAMSSDESIVQAYTVSLEKSNLRTYIDVYESQLLYMEIGRVRRGNVTSERKVISEKKDFSQSFSQERHKKSEEQLNKMIDDIKKRGSKLITTKTYVDVIMYKKMIKEYLESILKYMYETKKDISFWQTQYFITVDTVDNKLEELTKGLLSDEKDNINIASTIDEIQGMIVDIYR